LQLIYRDKRRNDGHLYYDATSDAELELKVERLRDELAELRRAFETWQKEVLERLTITTKKIRAHLRESAERTHQAALAEAAKARGWEERERLRKAAEQAHAGRLSRINELADSFAEIEGTGRATQVFDEMTRILAEEGVDQALAYVATQRPGILEKVKARAAATREKNRADLLPLLKSAQLEANRNQPAEADRLFADILALEPDWADARNAYAWFLIQQGMTVEPAKGNLKLRKAAEICQGTLALNQRGKSPQDWAATQNNLGSTLQKLGTRSGAEEGRKLLQDAVAAYRSALEVRIRADLPQDWAATQNNLGYALQELGTRSGAEEGRKLLQDAVAAYRSALEVRTRADLPQDWAMTENNLGNALQKLGTRSGGEEGRKLLQDAVVAFRSAPEVYTRADLPQYWAGTQYNLSDALGALGNQLEGEEGLKRKREAVELLRDVVSYQPDDLSRSRLASALGGLAFTLVLDSQFAEAQTRCEEAQRLANAIGDGVQKSDRDNLIFI